MSLSGVDRGTGTHNTSATTFTAVPASNLTAGAMAVMCISADNANTGGVAFSTFTVTDTKLNTWTRRASPLYDPGAINAGVEGGIFTTPQNGGALLTSDTITVTFNIVTVAKVWTLMEVVGEQGAPQAISSGVNAGAATAAPTVTTVALETGDMVIGACFDEHGTAQTPTGDSDTTNGSWSTMQTNEIGTTAAGQTVISQRKVVTAAATQTYNPTLGTSSDCILAWIQIIESDVGQPNLLTFTEQVDNAAWTNNGVTISVNATTAPDGAVTADKLVETAVNAVHGVNRATPPVFNANTVYTRSVYAKQAEKTKFYIEARDLGGTFRYARFDLAGGTAYDVGVGNTAAISAAANGFYRCSITFNSATGANSENGGQYIVNAADATSYLGVVTDGVYAWGAQYQRGELSAYKAVPYQPFPYNPWLQRGPILAQ